MLTSCLIYLKAFVVHHLLRSYKTAFGIALHLEPIHRSM
jgi:hypothetical protein